MWTLGYLSGWDTLRRTIMFRYALTISSFSHPGAGQPLDIILLDVHFEGCHDHISAFIQGGINLGCR